MMGIKKIFKSASSVITVFGLLILGGLALHQGVEATKVVAMPIFLLAGGHAATRAYKDVKGVSDDK